MEELPDFDPTESSSNINEPISQEEWDSLIPKDKETQNKWWERVKNRFRDYNSHMKDTLWNRRNNWDDLRTEYIPLNELYNRESSQDLAADRIKEKFWKAKTNEFLTFSDEDNNIWIKLKRKGAVPYKILDSDDNILNPKISSTLKNALGNSIIDSAEKNDELIERNYEDNEHDRDILEDTKSSEGDKESARERIAKREKENESLKEQNSDLEEKMTLKEKVKRIFKKYGLTVVGVFLATSAIVTAIIEIISRRLGQVANGVGNGLKAIGKKLGELIPGIIGSVVSFLFRMAGETIGFIGKNAWLLIVAVVVFLIERIKKSTK